MIEFFDDDGKLNLEPMCDICYTKMRLKDMNSMMKTTKLRTTIDVHNPLGDKKAVKPAYFCTNKKCCRIETIKR